MLAETLGTLNPFRYRGYIYDEETGLYYCQSRYYDPSVGRWINQDEFVSTGQGLRGINMFSVKVFPEFATNPYNIQFLTRAEYLLAHGNNWRNATAGRFIATSAYTVRY